MVSSESERHVDALLRGMEILEVLEAHPHLTLAQIHEKTGITKSRILRMCGTFVSRGFMGYDPETGRYSLGPRLMLLGRAYQEANPLVPVVRQALKELVAETKETASFYVLSGMKRLCLVREESPMGIRYSTPEGVERGLHSGAAGKLILAFSSEEVRNLFFAEKKTYEAYTPNSVTSAEAMKKEIEEARLRGFARSIAERIPDAWSLGVPVFGAGDVFRGAMVLSGPLSRLDDESERRMLLVLRRKGEDLSFRLGCSVRIEDM